MKKITIILCALLSLVLIMGACEKDTSVNDGTEKQTEANEPNGTESKPQNENVGGETADTSQNGDGETKDAEVTEDARETEAPKLKDAKIGGTPLSEYTILYQQSNGSATATQGLIFAVRLREQLLALTNEKLDTKARENNDKEHFITIDTSCLEYTFGEIKVEGGNVSLFGSYHSIDKVFEEFAKMLKAGDVNDGVTEIDTADLPEIYSKEDLMAVMQYCYDNDDIIIAGDEINNSRQVPSYWLDVYKNGDGKKHTGTDTYPSILGLDLGRCGFNLPYLSDDEWAPVSQMICEVIDYAAQGGIVTFGNHFKNPTTPDVSISQCDRGTLGGTANWDLMLTEGNEINDRFQDELNRIATVFSTLRNAGVPIIWRPFHEMDGGWFWWTPEKGYEHQYKAMWTYMYNYFTEECGLDNLIWHYSPSTTKNLMAYYPGDEYVDMVGIDWYTKGNLEIVGGHDPYVQLMNTGKIVSLAEVGITGDIVSPTRNYKDQDNLFNAENFIGTIESLIKEEYKIAYFLTYNDVHSLAYLPGGDDVMQSEFVLDLSEMPALFEKVTGFKSEN